LGYVSFIVENHLWISFTEKVARFVEKDKEQKNKQDQQSGKVQQSGKDQQNGPGRLEF
jgi:hypothetical protein